MTATAMTRAAKTLAECLTCLSGTAEMIEIKWSFTCNSFVVTLLEKDFMDYAKAWLTPDALTRRPTTEEGWDFIECKPAPYVIFITYAKIKR